MRILGNFFPVVVTVVASEFKDNNIGLFAEYVTIHCGEAFSDDGTESPRIVNDSFELLLYQIGEAVAKHFVFAIFLI
ncbi:hypothetical protein D3C81_2021760 [compost metagenome]